MIEALEVILKELGALLLMWRKKNMTSGRWEGTQFKADADRDAHNFLLNHLCQTWPGVPVISEEGANVHDAHRPDEYWLVDPIDGTASFCDGFDGFVTQVALMRGRRTVLAVVHAPALGLTYTATQDSAALCNGVRISTTACGARAPILIDNYPEPQGIAHRLYDAIGCDGYIESGSIGLKICRVADGTADLFVKNVTVRDWDLAPADLILVRAGGILTTLAGDPIPYDGNFERVGLIAAANSELAARFRKWNIDSNSESAVVGRCGFVYPKSEGH